MNVRLLATVSMVALLGACASQNNPTVGNKDLARKVEREVKTVPKWYQEMPEKDGSIFTVGTSTAPDLQLAVDIAILNGKTVLADRINGKLKSMTKQFVAKLGQSDIDSTVMSEVEKVSKNVIANVDVAGYNPSKIKVVPSGTQFRAYVLLEYSDKEAYKIIMNRMRKDRMVYSRIRSTQAWKELEKQVQMSEKSDEAKSMVNVEKLISNEKTTN